MEMHSFSILSVYDTRTTQTIACRSNSVSYEFYQIMVGSPTMSLHGWRQLAEWSIQYSCLTTAEKEEAFSIFSREWEVFCGWIIEEFDAYADTLDVQM